MHESERGTHPQKFSIQTLHSKVYTGALTFQDLCQAVWDDKDMYKRQLFRKRPLYSYFREEIYQGVVFTVVYLWGSGLV